MASLPSQFNAYDVYGVIAISATAAGLAIGMDSWVGLRLDEPLWEQSIRALEGHLGKAAGAILAFLFAGFVFAQIVGGIFDFFRLGWQKRITIDHWMRVTDNKAFDKAITILKSKVCANDHQACDGLDLIWHGFSLLDENRREEADRFNALSILSFNIGAMFFTGAAIAIAGRYRGWFHPGSDQRLLYWCLACVMIGGVCWYRWWALHGFFVDRVLRGMFSLNSSPADPQRRNHLETSSWW